VKRRGFTLIELLVVIAIIALLIGILVPALAKARNAARMAQSLSNMHQIAAAHEMYRVEKRDALPIPVVFTSDTSTSSGGGVHLIGGKFCRSTWIGDNRDYWPGERLLNPFTNSNAELPQPRDLNPGWVYGTPRPPLAAGVRESLDLPNWRSPGDKKTLISITGPSSSVTQYDETGTSYFSNIFWIEAASYAYTGSNTNTAGWRRAIVWGTKAYTKIDSSKFVVATDSTAPTIRTMGQLSGSYPAVEGEFGGQDMSVMGFADGHSAYIQMIRKPTGSFPFSENGMGSLTYPGFNYSMQIDDPKPN
jgi:prepilin-type N-terminal cleavage/methylation domain-containing protein